MASTIQRAFSFGEIASSLGGRGDLSIYQQALATCRNMIVRPEGGIDNRPGSQFIAEVKASANPTLFLKFVFNADQTYIIEAGNLYFRFYRNAAEIVSAGNPYEIVTPYLTADLPLLRYFQQGDVVILTHPLYVPQQLKRFGHTNWTLTPFTTVPGIGAPVGLNAIAGTGTSLSYKYQVTAVASGTNEESLVSNTSTVACDPPSTTAPNTLAWTATTGAQGYNVYLDQAGNGQFGFIGFTPTNAYNDIGYIPDRSQPPPTQRVLFAAAGDYPQTGAFYQQRLLMGGSVNNPDTVDASQIGYLSNFTVHSPLEDDDAVRFRLRSRQVHEVRHLIELGKLLLLTSLGEWSLEGNQDGVLTPTGINPKQHGWNGSATTPPAVIGDTILYVQARGERIRNLQFNFETQTFSGQDLTTVSRHLFDGYTILRMDIALIPDSVLWCVRSDGTLLGLTYLPDQQSWGWHRHDTGDGDVYEDVCVVPEADQDAVYVLVKRTIQGVGRRFVERLPRRRVLDPLNGCPYADSFLTYSGAPVSSVSGLDHLEARMVTILADGNVLPLQPVIAGTVTLDRAYSSIVVGLPITADVETLDLDPPGTNVRDKKKAITNLSVLVDQSRGLAAGPDVNNLSPYPEDPPVDYGTPPALFSGVIDLPITSAWDDRGRVFIRHTDPLPLTILGIMPNGKIGG
jgi:hypothetical protein